MKPEEKRLLSWLAKNAEEHRKLMDDLPSDKARFAYAVEAIAKHELAMAVWSDPTQLHGISARPIKGIGRLREIFGQQFPTKLSMCALPVQDEAMAVAVCERFADPADRTN